MPIYLRPADLTAAILDQRADPSDPAKTDRLAAMLYLIADNLLTRYKMGADIEEFRQSAVALLWSKLDRFDAGRPNCNSFSFCTTVLLNEMRRVWRVEERQDRIADSFARHQEHKSYKGRRGGWAPGGVLERRQED